MKCQIWKPKWLSLKKRHILSLSCKQHFPRYPNLTFIRLVSQKSTSGARWLHRFRHCLLSKKIKWTHLSKNRIVWQLVYTYVHMSQGCQIFFLVQHNKNWDKIHQTTSK
jgi:hypothetical protein